MASLKVSDIERSLRGKGFEKDEGAKHTIYVLIHEGKKTPIFTFASRGAGAKEVGDSLIGPMARQLKIKKQEFHQLIECTLTGEGYVSLLKQRSILGGASPGRGDQDSAAVHPT